MTESKRDATPPVLGLYDRLVSAEESQRIDALTDARMALTSAPTLAQRREHLLDQLTKRLPEILDAVSNPYDSNDDKARAELKLITHLLREARLSAKQEDTPTDLPAEPLRLLHALHEPDTPPVLPETGLRRPWIFTSARSVVV